MDRGQDQILKDVFGQKATLAGMIEYAKDAVVSKTIINKPVGTVTLFAFDAGQQLSTHSAPYDAIVIAVDGQVKISIAEETHLLSNGEMIVMPANIPHSLTAETEFKMLLIMIKKENKA